VTASALEEVRDPLTLLRAWYLAERRDLPWRRPGIPAWDVLVSEVMLQQTPVSRVVPAYRAWLERWPGPAELSAASPADVLRQWDRLGYPRRALRLQAAAGIVMARHGGQVPDELDALLALPGVGEYTARAVLVFAHGRRAPVVDTNVRRVVVRWAHGKEAADRLPLAEVERLLPADLVDAVLTSAALMELGAVTCVARSPRCGACPLAGGCRWREAGAPPLPVPRRVGQLWEGTVRQARGRIMALLRAGPGTEGTGGTEGTEGTASADEVLAAVPDASLRQRAIAGLVADGLAVVVERGDGELAQLALPG